MFGPSMGTYMISSKSDPRFNATRRCEGSASSRTPQWVVDEAMGVAKRLGLDDFPDDLICEFMKD